MGHLATSNRKEAMADRQAIIDVIGRYGYGLDELDEGLLGGVFSQDAQLRFTLPDGSETSVDGAEQVIRYVLDVRREQNEIRRHVYTNFWFREETDRSATVVLYIIVFVVGEALDARSTGVYVIDAVQGGDEWLIQRIDINFDLEWA
jgi:hypothetical protein